MYPIDSDVLTKFKQSNKQLARLTFGQTTITEENIVENGLSINRYCTSGDMIEIGSTVSAEMNVILDNYNGDFSDVSFNGQEIFVEVGVYDDNDEPQYIPMGYFRVDGSPRKLTRIALTALDRMMNFEKPINTEAVFFPYTVSELLTVICEICDIELGIDPSELLNADFAIPELPDSVSTYRDLLANICEITGTCAFFDWNGELILKWYEETDTVITNADRYNSDLYEEPIEITGVQVIDGENLYIAGEEGYILTVDDNPLIQNNWQDIADSLNEAMVGFTYTPFSASVLSMPHLYPLDMITFVDKDGNEVPTIITDWTFQLYTNTEIRGRGVTAERMGYGRDYSYTKAEAVLIEKLVDSPKDKMGFYESRNGSAISILAGSRKRIVYLKMTANVDTRVQVHVEVNLESEDTDSNGYTEAICTYIINGDEVTSIYPTGTYIDGKHVLHLMYIVPIAKYEVCYFNVYMRANSGNIIISKGGLWAYASGLGIVGDSVWNGELTLFDDPEPFTIRQIGFADDTTDTVTISLGTPLLIGVSDTVTDFTIPQIGFTNVRDRMRTVIYNEAYVRGLEDGDTRSLEQETSGAEVDIRTTEQENENG